jgi:hypothetical protein
VQVPCCCWHRSCALPKSASNNLQKWFISPTGRLNFGFILRENLMLCSSYLPLEVSQRILWDISGECGSLVWWTYHGAYAPYIAFSPRSSVWNFNFVTTFWLFTIVVIPCTSIVMAIIYSPLFMESYTKIHVGIIYIIIIHVVYQMFVTPYFILCVICWDRGFIKSHLRKNTITVFLTEIQLQFSEPRTSTTRKISVKLHFFAKK